MTESLDVEDLGLRPSRSARGTKLAIVGAGAVGSTMAYAALLRGAARTVALYDIDAAKVQAEVLDLGHGIQFMPMAQVIGSDDIAVCADADVVMFTAGAKQKPGQSRIELAGATIGLVKKVLPQLVQVAPHAVYVMVTNPVDVVTYAALQVSGLSVDAALRLGHRPRLLAPALPHLPVHRRRRAERARLHRRRARGQRAAAVGLGEHRLGPAARVAGPGRPRPADAGRTATTSPARSSSRRTGSSRARARRTTRSRWPARGSSRRSSRTRAGCCRSRRC